MLFRNAPDSNVRTGARQLAPIPTAPLNGKIYKINWLSIWCKLMFNFFVFRKKFRKIQVKWRLLKFFWILGGTLGPKEEIMLEHHWSLDWKMVKLWRSECFRFYFFQKWMENVLRLCRVSLSSFRVKQFIFWHQFNGINFMASIWC